MQNLKKAITVLLLVLCLTGCTANQVITDLEMVLAGVETVFPIVASVANLPPAITQQVSTYLAAVSNATAQSSTILASPGTAGQHAAQITSLFAGIAKPLLPAGTPANVAGAVDAVAQAVARFLANFAGAAPAAKNARAAQTVVTPKPEDVKRLNAAHSRALADADKAKAIK